MQLGGTVSDSILVGTRHFLLLTLYNFKNTGGGGGGTCPPAPWSQNFGHFQPDVLMNNVLTKNDCIENI